MEAGMLDSCFLKGGEGWEQGFPHSLREEDPGGPGCRVSRKQAEFQGRKELGSGNLATQGARAGRIDPDSIPGVSQSLTRQSRDAQTLQVRKDWHLNNSWHMTSKPLTHPA